MGRLTRSILILSPLAAGLNFMDLLTTWLGLQIGLREGNPSAATLIAQSGFESFALVKVVYSLAILMMGILFVLRASHYSKGVKSIAVVMLGLLCVYFAFTVLQNITLLA